MPADTILPSLMTLATVIAAGISAKAALDTVRETRASGIESAERNRIAEQQRQVLMRPHVVIYLRPGKTYDDFTNTTLYVHNVGPGAARAVEVLVLKGGEFKLDGGSQLGEWGVVQEGLSVLPPGDAVTTGFSGVFNKEALKEMPEILVEVRYRDIEGKTYEAERFPLDLKFLCGTTGPARTKHSDDPLERIARVLERRVTGR